MFNSPNPFEQQSSNPFASQSGFPQTSIATANPFAPKPFGSTSPFGSQTGTSIFGGTSTGVFGAPQASSPFSSTTTFGASSSPAFGTTMSAFGASSTPALGSSSSAFGGSSVFGQKPAFGGFGSTPTQTSPFMSTSQQSQPAFGSSIFGSSSPFGATIQSAFGATSTPAFGSTSTPAFGASSTPAFGATSTPSFGATSSPAFGAPTTPSFGSTSSLPFGSTGSAFGVSTSPAFGAGGAFGASNTPVFGSPSTSAFGASSAPVFGTSSTPAFGASSSPTFGFGSSPAFGQSTSAFGSNTFGSNSTPFGTQSSAFGAQSTTTFGSQRGGTRIAAYTPTTEPDSGSGSQGAGKLESISAMPVYKDKCHEELRWEDYQLGDKGGPFPAGQSAVGVGFNSSTPSQPNLLTSSATFGQAPSTFGQAPANPFSTPTSSNPFAPKTSAFGTTSNFSFGSSAFAPSTSSNLFGSTVSPSTSSFISTSTAPFGSSPSLFNSSSTPAFGSQSTFGSATTAGSTPPFGPSINFGNTQTSPLFPTSTPSIGQTGSAFGQSTSTFGQNTTSFGQSSLGTAPTSVFGNNLFSSAPSLMPSSTPAFGQSASTFSTPFQPAQTQPAGAFGFGNFGQAQPAGTSGIGGTSSIFGQNGFGQLSASHASVVAQPAPVTNPFGTLPVMPQMSIGRTGNTSSIQYGISSMPVVDKPPPMKISSLLTSRHLSQRRIRLPAKKYHPKKDGSQVPFFSEDEETPGTPKADALFIPRENPRSLVIRPAEQWSTRTSAEKSASVKETSGLHVNGKNPEETSISSDFGIRDKNGNSVENGLEKEPSQLHGVNQKTNGNPKTNGFHEDSIQKGETYMTVNGNRAGEAAIAYEHGADIEALMPKLRLADYYTEPKIQELAAKERAYPGFCSHVKDFVVGRHGFGSIKFFGETDVRRIDLDSLVQFNNREVIVYMDDTKKPPVGQGLNKPAEVTLLNIKCFDKKTGWQYTEGPKVEKYKEMLKRKAEDQGAKFVSYDPVEGEWKFKVNHFSKYSVGDEDEVSEWE